MYYLLSVIGVAFGTVMLVWSSFKILRRKPPRYLLPTVAGVTILCYATWDDYTWFERMAEKLPPHIQVVDSFQTTAFWQPWTYAWPRTNRFIAINRAETRRNGKLPGMVMTEMILVKKQDPTRVVTQMIDCDEARVMDIGPTTAFADDGLPQQPDWHPIARDNKLFLAACST
ncbi:hypothetical protein JCM17960_03970 [Magnetospira thiophila]